MLHESVSVLKETTLTFQSKKMSGDFSDCRHLTPLLFKHSYWRIFSEKSVFHSFKQALLSSTEHQTIGTK